MAKLGSFNAAVREFDPDAERDTFELAGEEFVVEGVIPPMLVIHLGAAMAGKAGRAEGSAAVWQALRCALSRPERRAEDGRTVREDRRQFDRFYQHAVASRIEDDELIALVFTLVGAQAGKVDTPPSTSPPGAPSTSTGSNSSASDTPDSPDSSPLVSVEERLAGLT